MTSSIFVDNPAIYGYIASYLRDARKAKRLRQQDLARMVGITRTSVVNMEAGKQRIPIHLLYKFCAALDVEIWDLFPAVKDVVIKL